nr:MAG TPA: hypothetical protein [Caudoviricetes sp.]
MSRLSLPTSASAFPRAVSAEALPAASASFIWTRPAIFFLALANCA